MKVGVRLPNSGPFASPEAITAMAIAAEKLGYDAVSPHDHVNWGYDDRYHFYAGNAEAADAQERPTNFYEAFSTMSYIVGITQRVRLIPAALCLAWRPVLLLARQALTLHRLSEGRFVLCVCVGNVPRDFEVTGTPWDQRGAIAVEKLKVLRMLIDNPGPVSFEGKYVKFKDAELSPRPEGLQLWYAGADNDIAIKRTARYGEGMMGGGGKMAELRQEAERVGRGGVTFELCSVSAACIAPSDEEAWSISRQTVEAHTGGDWTQRTRRLLTQRGYADPERRRPRLIGSPETVAAGVREHAASGYTTLLLGFMGHTLDSLLEQMEVFAKEVMPRDM